MVQRQFGWQRWSCCACCAGVRLVSLEAPGLGDAPHHLRLALAVAHEAACDRARRPACKVRAWQVQGTTPTMRRWGQRQRRQRRRRLGHSIVLTRHFKRVECTCLPATQTISSAERASTTASRICDGSSGRGMVERAREGGRGLDEMGVQVGMQRNVCDTQRVAGYGPPLRLLRPCCGLPALPVVWLPA